VPERTCGCSRWLRIVTGLRAAVRCASGVLLACVGMGTAWASGLAAADVAGGGDAGHGDGPGWRVGRAGYRRQDGGWRVGCCRRGRAFCGRCAQPRVRVGGGAR